MKLDRAFLRSKVARRILLLFILCALLPIAALAFIAFSHVTRQLHEQSQRRLHQASKAAGLAIFERLLFLETELTMAAAASVVRPGAPIQPPSRGSGHSLIPRFSGLALLSDGGGHRSLLGRIENPPQLGAAERYHLRTGKTVLSSQDRAPLPARIVLSRALDAQRPDRGILLGEINDAYLWGIGTADTLPAMTELCVLDEGNRVLICSVPGPVSFPEQVTLAMRRTASGQFAWRHDGKEYLASYWSIPLQFRFLTPKWTVVLSEAKADVLAPMANFTRTFPLVILMSLWVVLLLSLIQIRRSLVPLEKLQEGTRRIARQEFESRVTVSSGDEFEELAASFNTMASRLGRQFHALRTMAEIDRAVLSALDQKAIATTVLTRMCDILPCDAVAVTLLDAHAPERGQTYIGDGGPRGEQQVEAAALTPEEVQQLRENPEGVLRSTQPAPQYLASLARRGIAAVLLLPIFLEQRLSGIITLGYRDPPALTQEDLEHARQVANQVAVALSNARLIEELDRLNWGTLTALARAIDAKSAWTAGHSERVTRLALKIGQVLGLGPKELETLHRGGLLHDIGKLGVPAAILDKPGELTEAEAQLMRDHVRMGARILEPIAAYADVLPIVLEHHEWFDGTGYPNGLAGEALSLAGRIFAVADCFDGLLSDRPYRAGLDRHRVIEHITQGTGRQFDPKVVQAFLEVMAQEGETR